MEIKNKWLNIFFVIIIFVLFAISSIIYVGNAEIVNADYDSTAKSMVVLDADSDIIFYSKNENQQLPMASTTKIVTALTVLKKCNNLDEMVKIDNRAVGVPGTSIYLKKGEELSVRELLYGMMLPSGNDAATALAYHIGGSMQSFVTMMNNTAIECGAINSSFANPHGLDDKNHYTTAYDLAKITAEALRYDEFLKIVTTKNIKITGYGDQKYRYLKNKNKLLSTLDGCIGVKTGYTDDAGRCLVSACERNGIRAVCVVLNCGPMFEESYDMLSSVFKNYQKVELLSPYKFLRSLNVINGKSPTVKCYTIKSFSKILSNDEIKDIRYEYNLPNYLEAPIKKDQIVGELKIYLKNDLLFSEKIYTMEDVKSISIKGNIQEILSRW